MISNERLLQLRKSQLLSIESRKRNVLARKEKEKRIYDLSPVKCILCGGDISFDMYSSPKNSGKFCSQSCATKYNNYQRAIPCSVCGKRYYGKTKYKEYVCRSCYLKKLGVVESSESFFVSPNGSRVRNYENRLKKLINGEYSDNSARYFFRTITEIKCSICGRKEWDGMPIPVTVDHIDGDYKNNKLDNLRFVCRNCEAFLPTFGSKNRGRGRPDTRSRTPKAERENFCCVICEKPLFRNQLKYCSKSCKNKHRNNLERLKRKIEIF